MKRLSLLLFSITFVANLFAQEVSFSDAQVAKYINKFKELAMSEQVRTGVPASITLAQGLLETGCGTSPLAIEAKNHFGIKCKKDWTGETMLHDDDAIQECFRKYPTDNESYIDHSNFLKNNRRYAFLFDIPAENYKDWAIGLRRAGYATSPTYSARLIALIEKHSLQQFTEKAQVVIRKSTEEQLAKEQAQVLQKDKEAEIIAAQKKKTRDSIAAAKAQLRETELAARAKAKLEKEKNDALRKENEAADALLAKTEKEKKIIAEKSTSPEVNADKYLGLEGFYAKKGDRLLQASIERGIRYQKLLELNDLDDEELPVDMFIFTQKKYKRAPTKKSHIVLEGEDMMIIAQREAMQLRQLLALNLLKINDTPAVGQRVYLQDEVSRAPLLRGQTPKQAQINVLANNTSSEKSDEEQQKLRAQEEANAKAQQLAQQLFDKQQEKARVDEQAAADAVIKAAEKAVEEASNAEVEEQAKPIQAKTDLDLEEFQRQQTELANGSVNTDKSNTDVASAGRVEAPIIKEQANERNTIVESTSEAAVAAVPVIEKPLHKTPSNYNENGVSAEVRKLKKVMDEVVYMAPPPPKPKIVDTVVQKIRPAIKPSVTQAKPNVPVVKPNVPAVKNVAATAKASDNAKGATPIINKTNETVKPTANKAKDKAKDAKPIESPKAKANSEGKTEKATKGEVSKSAKEPTSKATPAKIDNKKTDDAKKNASSKAADTKAASAKAKPKVETKPSKDQKKK
jgi:hypothetical protein